MGLANNEQNHAGARGVTIAYLFQHLLLAVFEPTRSNDDIKTKTFIITFFRTFFTLLFGDCTSEPWTQIAFITESPSEERANAFYVTIEVPLSRTSFSIWSPRYPDGTLTIPRSCERC